MYAFVDRPVENLCNSGRFLLWAMRGWTDAARRGRCPAQALHRGFACVRAEDVLHDFHAAMALIAADALTPIALAPMPCVRIAEDEAILLGLWRDVTRGDGNRVRATLALLVARGSVASIVNAMSDAHAALTAAGFDLSDLSPHARHQENP